MARFNKIPNDTDRYNKIIMIMKWTWTSLLQIKEFEVGSVVKRKSKSIVTSCDLKIDKMHLVTAVVFQNGEH